MNAGNADILGGRRTTIFKRILFGLVLHVRCYVRWLPFPAIAAFTAFTAL
jgi:hypothetical protein